METGSLYSLGAGLVDRPEDYRWNSIGYHIQTGNKDSFLSLDFGLKEFGPGEIRSAVTSEFHPSTIVPTYGAGRAGILQCLSDRIKILKIKEISAWGRPLKGLSREKTPLL
jgi:hypothetical protein